ncbi:MAG: hypothetical protein Sapg2KO_23470 [Saprospiraceae bacterium]
MRLVKVGALELVLPEKITICLGGYGHFGEGKIGKKFSSLNGISINKIEIIFDVRSFII